MARKEAKRKTKRTKKQTTVAKKSPIKGLTPKQVEYLRSLKDNELIVCTGPAGTGKTFCATATAADWYVSHKIDKIILTRPNVPAGKSLGYFPGTLEEKLAPWVAPFVDILEERMGKGALECGIKNNNIEFIPFETMRGRTFNNSCVILDEAQNTSKEEMKMFLTRLGRDSITIVDGDVTQSDIKSNSKDGGKDGLSMLLDMLDTYHFPHTTHIEFTSEDVVRSGLCKRFVMAFNGDLSEECSYQELRESSFMG